MQVTEQVKNILVIDDDKDDCVLVKDLINKNMGHEKPNIEFAHDFNQALELCYENDFDIFLLDYRLGKKDGLKVLQSFREAGIITPIIFLTGQGDEEIAVKAMKAGAADYFSKHKLTSTNFVKAIRSAVRDNKRLQSLEDFI